MITVHSEYRNIVEKRLAAKGYKILGRNVKIDGIVINNTYIVVDIMVEKDGNKIPVEVGYVQRPKHERMTKLKEKFGQVIHVRYGHERRSLYHKMKTCPASMMFCN